MKKKAILLLLIGGILTLSVSSQEIIPKDNRAYTPIFYQAVVGDTSADTTVDTLYSDTLIVGTYNDVFLRFMILGQDVSNTDDTLYIYLRRVLPISKGIYGGDEVRWADTLSAADTSIISLDVRTDSLYWGVYYELILKTWSQADSQWVISADAVRYRE